MTIVTHALPVIEWKASVAICRATGMRCQLSSERQSLPCICRVTGMRCHMSSNRHSLPSSISCPIAVSSVQGWWDQGPGLAGDSCGFWWQESSLLLFSISFLFYQCLVLNKGTGIVLHVWDVGGLGISIIGGSVLCFCTWCTKTWGSVLSYKKTWGSVLCFEFT